MQLVRPPTGLAATWLPRILIAGVAMALAMQAAMALRVNVNWDEFYYLSKVHAYLRGEPVGWLQSLQVHLFAWLPLVGNEVDQVIAGRGVQWLCVAGASLFLFRVARRFTSREGALFAVLAWFAINFVTLQGTSFRADPIVTFLGMGAIDAALERRSRGPALAGLLMGVAVLVSIKALMFALLVGGVIAVDRWGSARRLAADAATFVGALAATGGVLYLLHGLALPPTADGSPAARLLEASGRKMFFDAGLLPRWRELVLTLISSPWSWILIFAGVGYAIAMLRRDPRRALILLGLAAPLASIIVYRNAFSYFYVTIGAPAAVLAGLAADRLLVERRRLALALACVLAVMPLYLARHNLAEDRLAAQREMVALVHRLFPEPVPYLDKGSMIASFPQAGFFMTMWGLESYRRAGRPIFAERIIPERKPVFLLANMPALEPMREGAALEELGEYRLFDADLAALRENFVHHWGALWVAGKRLDLPAGGGAVAFDMAVPGTYTLEADAPVRLDGAVLAPGGKAKLNEGRHSIASTDGAQRVILRWGADLPRPDHPPAGRIFTGL